MEQDRRRGSQVSSKSAPMFGPKMIGSPPPYRADQSEFPEPELDNHDCFQAISPVSSGEQESKKRVRWTMDADNFRSGLAPLHLNGEGSSEELETSNKKQASIGSSPQNNGIDELNTQILILSQTVHELLSKLTADLPTELADAIDRTHYRGDYKELYGKLKEISSNLTLSSSLRNTAENLALIVEQRQDLKHQRRLKLGSDKRFDVSPTRYSSYYSAEAMEARKSLRSPQIRNSQFLNIGINPPKKSNSLEFDNRALFNQEFASDPNLRTLPEPVQRKLANFYVEAKLKCDKHLASAFPSLSEYSQMLIAGCIHHQIIGEKEVSKANALAFMLASKRAQYHSPPL